MNILIAGDFCPQNRIVLMNREEFSQAVSGVKPFFNKADYSLVNLECPLADSSEGQIVKQGPCLKAPNMTVSFLKELNVKCVTLANNHFRDFGTAACENTFRRLEQDGIEYVGAGSNLHKARAVLYKSLGGETFAFINFCEHEFSVASESEAGAADIDLVHNYWQIKEASDHANHVIVIVHGGHEHFQLPSIRMQETYRWFIDIGADVVVNHHQHCYSGYELYKGKPIFYGIGNFCFDGNRTSKELWYTGYLVGLTFSKNIGFELIPFVQCKEMAGIRLLEHDDLIEFNRSIEELNKIIGNRALLTEYNEQFYRNKDKEIKLLLSPYSSRITKALARRGFLPSGFKKDKALALLNYVDCESHRDVFLSFLTRSVK